MKVICKVCGRYFRAKKEDRYEVTVNPVGLSVLTERTKTYECFDCPKCGCQNIVNIKEVDDCGSIVNIKEVDDCGSRNTD